MGGNRAEGKRLLLSIGHSNHPTEHFLNLLAGQGVDVLVDIRSHPYSRYAPQFDGPRLKGTVENYGIRYLYMGRELGGRPAGSEYYDPEGHILYSRIADSPEFMEGIRRLENGVQNYRVAVMCSEEDPTDCHRRLLVGRVLAARGLRLDHIRGTGRVQTEEEVADLARRRETGHGQMQFFPEPEVVVWRSTQSVLPSGKRKTASQI